MITLHRLIGRPPIWKALSPAGRSSAHSLPKSPPALLARKVVRVFNSFGKIGKSGGSRGERYKSNQSTQGRSGRVLAAALSSKFAETLAAVKDSAGPPTGQFFPPAPPPVDETFAPSQLARIKELLAGVAPASAARGSESVASQGLMGLWIFRRLSVVQTLWLFKVPKPRELQPQGPLPCKMLLWCPCLVAASKWIRTLTWLR